jgi:predicted nucleotide-binding protein/phosphoserine phosphatase
MFLDVDNTLTKGLIQARFADLLGVTKEYERIEDQLQKFQITSQEFGTQLIELFNKAGFSEAFAADHYRDIERHEWVKDLLALPVAMYFVSSGPSYYIMRFAREHAIPDANVLCSEYQFDKVTGQLSGCKGVSDATKASFVLRQKRKHTISVGVGDNAKKDGPFLSATDIPILTAPNDSYLSVGSLEVVTAVVANLCAGLPTPRNRPTVFIGSSTKSLAVANAVHALLDHVSYPTVWTAGVFEPSKTNIEALESSLSKFDFAIFIMTPDDVVIMRDEQRSAVRDNVLFEVGLFMGRLGRERCFLVQPRNEKPRLPTDIDGLVLLDYPGERLDDNLEAALTPAAERIKKSIEKYGCRTFAI